MNKRIDYIFDSIAIVFASVQPEVLFRYVSLALSIFATLISIAFSIWQWWKIVKQDGIITEDEIKEGAKIIQDGTEKIKHTLDDKDKEE